MLHKILCHAYFPVIFKEPLLQKKSWYYFENHDSLSLFYLCVHLSITENWWSLLEPPLFLKIVELFKEVVVHLLKLYKIGIPPTERRIFNSFLHTALKVLEILHRVCPIVYFPFPIATNRLMMLNLTLIYITDLDQHKRYIIEFEKVT